jgi:hypothetical protein
MVFVVARGSFNFRSGGEKTAGVIMMAGRGKLSSPNQGGINGRKSDTG